MLSFLRETLDSCRAGRRIAMRLTIHAISRDCISLEKNQLTSVHRRFSPQFSLAVIPRPAKISRLPWLRVDNRNQKFALRSFFENIVGTKINDVYVPFLYKDEIIKRGSNAILQKRLYAERKLCSRNYTHTHIILQRWAGAELRTKLQHSSNLIYNFVTKS